MGCQHELTGQIFIVEAEDTETINFKDGKLHGVHEYEREGYRYGFNYKNGKLHSEDDQPAEWHYWTRYGINNESETWYKDGVVYRENGPASELHEGDESTFFYYVDGKYRTGGAPYGETYVKGVLVAESYIDQYGISTTRKVAK